MATIEIQCTSCNTRYRIDERVLPGETATFKCSRCGHVFTAQAPRRTAKPVAPAEPAAPEPSTTSETEVETSREPEAATPPLETESASPGETEASPPQRQSVSRKLGAHVEGPRLEQAKPQAPEAARCARSPVDAVGALQGTLGGVEQTAAERTAEGKRRADDDAAKRGENFFFNFFDEPELGAESSSDDLAAEEWKVGDDISPAPGAAAVEAQAAASARASRYAGARASEREEIPDEASFLERSRLHSAGYFIGQFFIVALVFIAATLVIFVAAPQSAEIMRQLPVVGSNFQVTPPLASMVALGDVRATYETLKGGHSALVVSGQARNGSEAALHRVEVGVRLLDAHDHGLSSATGYCGNVPSRKMIAEMTSHELEFLQQLGPQKGFVLKPTASAPFLVVFVDPPKGVSRFSVAVSTATAAPAAAGPQS